MQLLRVASCYVPPCPPAALCTLPQACDHPHMLGVHPQCRPQCWLFLLSGRFSTHTCTWLPLHLARSFLECHPPEALPSHLVYRATLPELYSSGPLFCFPTPTPPPQPSTPAIVCVPNSELSKGTHWDCLSLWCVFCTQHRTATERIHTVY